MDPPKCLEVTQRITGSLGGYVCFMRAERTGLDRSVGRAEVCKQMTDRQASRLYICQAVRLVEQLSLKVREDMTEQCT